MSNNKYTEDDYCDLIPGGKICDNCGKCLEEAGVDIRAIKIEDIAKNVQRLTNQLWKLIPMREHNENWQKQLETVLIEIAGLNELFTSPIILQLLSKLEGLNVKETNFEIYRKTIFECISLVRSI